MISDGKNRKTHLGRFLVPASVLLAAVFGFAGCGSSDAPELNLVPVTGNVKIDGKPVAGVTLTFLPDQETKGTGGFAATDAEGNFTVMHRTGQPGIEPGTYKVLASLLLQPNGQPVPSGESAIDLNATDSLPAKYSNPEQTPFHATIAAGSTEPLNFEISTK